MSAFGSEARVRTAIAELAQLVDQAGLGLGGWGDFTDHFCQIFPDSFCALNNQNRNVGSINYSVFSGFPEEGLRNFADHYCLINPLNSVWLGARFGEVIHTETRLPVSTIVNTEFYNDFLGRWGDFDIGIGTKVDATDIDEFVLLTHFPRALNDTYGPSVSAILEGLKGNLRRAAAVNRQYADLITNVVSAAALAGMSAQAAFVIDYALDLREANQKALEMFSKGDLLSAKGNRVRLKRVESQNWLQATVAALICGLPVSRARHVCETEDQTWLLSAFRVPEDDPRSINSIFGVRQLALITITDLRQTNMPMIERVVAGYFNLTSPEEKLCELLMFGMTLKDCSDHLGLSIETIRSRLKTIFSKTGTRRQADLVSLLTKTR